MTSFQDGFEKRSSRWGMFTKGRMFTHGALPGMAGGAIGAASSDEHPVAAGLAGAALGAGAGLGVLGLRNRSAYRNLLQHTKDYRKTTFDYGKALKARDKLDPSELIDAHRAKEEADRALAIHESIMPKDGDLSSHSDKSFRLRTARYDANKKFRDLFRQHGAILHDPNVKLDMMDESFHRLMKARDFLQG